MYSDNGFSDRLPENRIPSKKTLNCFHFLKVHILFDSEQKLPWKCQQQTTI